MTENPNRVKTRTEKIMDYLKLNYPELSDGQCRQLTSSIMVTTCTSWEPGNLNKIRTNN